MNDRDNNNLVRFTQASDYPVTKINGQIILGPSPAFAKYDSDKGAEIFVGNLPMDTDISELYDIFKDSGRIYTIRMCVNFSGQSRGFAFVRYTSERAVRVAIKSRNNYKIRPYRPIGVFKSIDNRRIFVKNVPEHLSAQEIQEKFDHHVCGITDVIMYPPPNPCAKKINRGYVFVEFETHKHAAMARKHLSSGICMWEDYVIYADWADPIPEVDPEVMEHVKTLYVRNIPQFVTQHQLRYLLSDKVPFNIITRVYKMEAADYAFVHFNSKPNAAMAMYLMQGMAINRQVLEFEWARPPTYSRVNRQQRPPENFCSSVPPMLRKMLIENKHHLFAMQVGIYINYPQQFSNIS